METSRLFSREPVLDLSICEADTCPGLFSHTYQTRVGVDVMDVVEAFISSAESFHDEFDCRSRVGDEDDVKGFGVGIEEAEDVKTRLVNTQCRLMRLV